MSLRGRSRVAARPGVTAPLLFLLCGFCGTHTVQGAYFNVHEGEDKCFMENMPLHQVLMVKHRHPDNPGVECMLLFKDPKGVEVFSKRIGPDDKDQGKTAYLTQTHGEHQVCVRCHGSAWFKSNPLKWELSIEMGESDFGDSAVAATKQDLNGVSRTMHAVLGRVEAVSAENDYEKVEEMAFRDASEEVNSHVVLVSVFIMVIEAALVLWQIRHLRTFFRREKLI